ncbi:hypothetical protein JXA56_03635 [Candidatus Micrarchaeota archaeon]|nr:hypothetical protein [Candidatus Micrarchaeota archaeon]
MFGCTGGEVTPGESTGPSIGIPKIEGPQDECTMDYSFSQINDGTFSKSSDLVVTVTCAGGSELALGIDGKVLQTAMVETNAATPVKFNVVGISEGSRKVTVKLDGETIYSRDWEVTALGHTDTLGTNYDTISYKEWLAMEFDIQNSVEVGQVRVFMMRQNPNTLPDSTVIMEIRKDSSGKPGDVIAQKILPIKDTTLSANWIRFNLDKKATLSPGKYWVVMRVDQTEERAITSDTVTIHHTPINRDRPGNDYTRKMRLDVDMKSGEVTETSWEPLSYDRIYNIVLAYGE